MLYNYCFWVSKLFFYNSQLDKKILGIAIRYISLKEKSLKSTFLCLKDLENGTGRAMAQAVEDVLKINNLKVENLIGICKCDCLNLN